MNAPPATIKGRKRKAAADDKANDSDDSGSPAAPRSKKAKTATTNGKGKGKGKVSVKAEVTSEDEDGMHATNGAEEIMESVEHGGGRVKVEREEDDDDAGDEMLERLSDSAEF